MLLRGTGDKCIIFLVEGVEYVLLRLRMHGAVPPLSQYIFMAWCLIKQWLHLHGVVLC